MRLSCNRKSLVEALATVNGVVPSRTPKEVLKNIRVEAVAGKATLIGTDQEIGMRQDVPNVETDQAGGFLVPAARAVAILREMPDDVVTIDASESAVVVSGGRSRFELAAVDASEFPPVEAFNADGYISLPAKELREMVRRTAFATDAESSRYALGGVLFDLAGETLTFAATDSRRLAVMSGKVQRIGEIERTFSQTVVPNKAMKLIEGSLPDSDELAFVSIGEKHVLVKCGGTTIYSRLVEGRFPQYADVIPSGFTATIDLMTGPLHQAVRQSQIVTTEESRGVDFIFENGILKLSSRAADIGTSSVELPISYDGPTIAITFDPRFVAEFLKLFDVGSAVKLNLIDGESPVLFTTEGGYRYVVMPLSRG